MTRPSGLRPQSSPFVRRREKPGAKKVEIDWDKIDDSYNHRLNQQVNIMALKNLREDLIQAEADGRYSKARKIRREISQYLEANLALSATWCRGCLNYLHNCKCKAWREGPHPNTIRARKRKEEKALERLERIHQELKARITNT